MRYLPGFIFHSNWRMGRSLAFAVDDADRICNHDRPEREDKIKVHIMEDEARRRDGPRRAKRESDPFGVGHRV